MTQTETRKYQMLTRVRKFGETHRDLLTATSFLIVLCLISALESACGTVPFIAVRISRVLPPAPTPAAPESPVLAASPDPPVVPALPVLPALPRRIANVAFFRLETGERDTVIAASDFQLYALELAGADITPILDDRCDVVTPGALGAPGVGFTDLRVFGQAANLFHFFPQEHADYYARLPAFARKLAAHRCRFRMEFVVLVDATVVMPDAEEQIRHWTAVVDALRAEPNVMFELGNELDQPVNRIDASRFELPAGVLASHGSNGSQATPVRPAWSYETFHTNDAFEWWRKVGHNAMELSEGGDGFRGSHVPVVANENTRAPDRFNAGAQAFDAAAGAALLVAGSTFHSDSGRFSRIFTPDERKLAAAWIAGARSVPLECQDGPYRHRIDLEGPGDLRVYQRGDNEACVVRIRK